MSSSTIERLTDSYYSIEFESINHQLRQHFNLANNEIEKVKGYVNDLVALVHGDNPSWSLKKICDYIAGKNDDLEELGFSSKTIYCYLNEENRKLIDARKSHSGKSGRKPKYLPSQELEEFRQQKGKQVVEEEKLQNIVMEQSVYDESKQNVPEQSSSSIVEEEEGTEEPEIIYDDPYKMIRELEEQIKNLVQPFTKNMLVEIKDQYIPIIVRVDPVEKDLEWELDTSELKRLTK